ncbi:MAG TPA: type II secretion system F family protein [Burkholderiales bacterium]|nr:type II secretion system F family protein [Burkholderiales bacterium]
MSETFLYTVLLPLSWAAFFALSAWGALRLFAKIPADDRTNMDPLPPVLARIWPLVRVFSYYVGSRLPYRYLEQTERRLRRSGLEYTLAPDQFGGVQAAAAALGVPLALIGAAAVRGEQLAAWVIITPIACALYPMAWLKDRQTRRLSQVRRTLPLYLDFIAMAIEAGLNMSGALSQAVAKGPGGPLAEEFGRVLRDVRAGLARADALRRLAERVEDEGVSAFVSAVVQAERSGASMAGTLRAMADQRRSERFLAAEKQAMEAPVKLVGPLVMFIFPVTFIILGFPLAMKFLQGGVL